MLDLEKFDNYNILVVGVGGTGSHLVSFLSQLIGNNQILKNKARLTLIDGDDVEFKNITTQKFLASDVGLKKCEVLADRYSAVFNIDIRYKDCYIENEKEIEELFINPFHGLNIIISCVDNNKCRRILDKVFNKKTITGYEYHSVLYIDTGNSSGEGELTGQTVVAYNYKGNIKQPSVSTFFPQMLEEENDDDETISCGEEMTKNIQNIGANITSATTVFNILNSVLCFNKIPANMCMFNASKLESEPVSI